MNTECGTCKTGKMRLHRSSLIARRLKVILKCSHCGKTTVTIYPPESEPAGA
jgi:hypothetical protein